MSVVLHVDGDRWRAHLRATLDRFPTMVPVAKGNGYGFGLHRLARRVGWLGADTIAVGTYDEVPAVADRFDGDIVFAVSCGLVEADVETVAEAAFGATAAAIERSVRAAAG